MRGISALLVSVWIIVLLGFILLPTASAVTETVFDENFDGALIGWSESLCNISNPSTQTCILDQATGLFDANEPPNSLPFWGFAEIEVLGGGSFVPHEVKYEKSFNVINEDDYIISSWLGIKDCRGLGDCHIATRVFVDGVIILERAGPDISDEPVGPHKFFEQTIIHLTPGPHIVEIGMLSPEGAINGNFRASFDDILIQRDVPEPPTVVGGEFYPVDNVSLVLAYGLVNSWWMAPIGIGIGVGIYLVKRRF